MYICVWLVWSSSSVHTIRSLVGPVRPVGTSPWERGQSKPDAIRVWGRRFCFLGLSDSAVAAGCARKPCFGPLDAEPCRSKNCSRGSAGVSISDLGFDLTWVSICCCRPRACVAGHGCGRLSHRSLGHRFISVLSSVVVKSRSASWQSRSHTKRVTGGKSSC